MKSAIIPFISVERPKTCKNVSYVFKSIILPNTVDNIDLDCNYKKGGLTRISGNNTREKLSMQKK